MYCAHCGSKNPEALEACDRCGEMLIRPDPAHPHHLGIKSCPDCSAVNESHARFCIDCGRDIDAVVVTSGTLPAAGRVRPSPPPTQAADRRPPFDSPRSPSPEVRRPSTGPGRPSVATGGLGTDAGAEDLRKGAPTTIHAPNDSGTPEAQLPGELKGWNWGAFFLPFAWGPFNRVWVGLSVLIVVFLPIPWLLGLLIYSPMALFVGLRGNEWAWRARKWESVDHFRKVQGLWTKWGTIGFAVFAVLTVLGAMANDGGL